MGDTGFDMIAALAAISFLAWGFAPVAFASGVAGALCVGFLPRFVLEGLIPLLLIAIALHFALSRKGKDEDAQARMPALAFGPTAPVAIGFCDGIFGPGSFYMLAFVTLPAYGWCGRPRTRSSSISRAISAAFFSMRRPARRSGWSGS